MVSRRAKPKKSANSVGNEQSAAPLAVEATRASKDGHRYHEAWTARRALELILPRDNLIAIAIEGLHEEDEKHLGSAAIEIADTTFYFGGISFKTASKIRVEQFKYSIANSSKDFSAVDSKKTLQKFAALDRDLAKEYGTQSVSEKAFYGISTNRPISKSFSAALSAASLNKKPADKKVKTELGHIKEATGLTGAKLADFARRITVNGYGDTLAQSEGNSVRTIADWSASNDIHVRARLGGLRQLIREKAGVSSQNNKLIVREDVLAALEIGDGDERALLPTPDAFPDPGEVVSREQLDEFASGLSQANLWLLHAAGGLGKTVFVQSLAKRLAANNEVVLFDCFGGGAYRIQADARHRPERGLMHIVNEIACRGLCDPILPGSSDPAEVVRTALKRFQQAALVLRRSRPAAHLVLILDAIDNAALEARDRGQPAFPIELLEALHELGPIDGVIIIGTCRTERRDLSLGRAKCKQFPLKPFSAAETSAFVLARRPGANQGQIHALLKRSGGNPRVLANLLTDGRSLSGEDTSPIPNVEVLIERRITDCIDIAEKKGAARHDIEGFLCALSLLPPPVPISELASAFGIDDSAIESFAADLSPLLERTRHGIIFRDEPTETLVRARYGNRTELLKGLVERLKQAQSTSAYAARSLPGLLFASSDVGSLRELAFDTRFPPTFKSEIAKRAIRLNRLRLAVAAAARVKDVDALTSLLVELSTVAAVNERGEDFLTHNPDLVVTLGDPEALRRLYEARSGWYGARPSRLSIAYTIDDDLGEAYYYAIRSSRWLQWLYDNNRDDHYLRAHPGINDYVATPFYQLRSKEYENAAAFLSCWQPQHQYNVSKRILELELASKIVANTPAELSHFLDFALREDTPSPFAAALFPHAELDDTSLAMLVRKLAAFPFTVSIRPDSLDYRETDTLQAAVLRAGLWASVHGMKDQACQLAKQSSCQRLQFWTISDRWQLPDVSANVIAVAIEALASERPVTLFECIPQEFHALLGDDALTVPPDQQEKAMRDAIARGAERKKDGAEKPKVSDAEAYQWPQVLGTRIKPIVSACEAVCSLACNARTDASKAADEFLACWHSEKDNAKKRDYGDKSNVRFIDHVFSTSLLQAIIALGFVTPNCARKIQQKLAEFKDASPALLTAYVEHLARNSKTAANAGELASLVLEAITPIDETKSRATSYAALARALLPADRDEAAQLFQKGYSELNAIGSDDYSLVAEMLSFASTVSEPPLDAPAAHRLAKICELNLYDTDKFPWTAAGQGFANAWGTEYLAQLSRWQDRDKADFDLTLGPALGQMLKNRQVSPATALVALSLTDMAETWSWRWADMLDALLSHPDFEPDVHAREFLDLLRRDSPYSPSEHSLAKIRKTLARHPKSMTSQIATGLAQLEKRVSTRESEHQHRDSDTNKVSLAATVKREKEEVRKALGLAKRVDATNTESLETLVEKLDAIHGRIDIKTQAFKLLRASLPYSKRKAHVEALSNTSNLELFAKLALLSEVKADWAKGSPTRLSYFRDIAVRIAELHAPELLGSDWGFSRHLEELSEITGDSIAHIAIKLAETGASRELSAKATAWLSLAGTLAPQASASVPRDALQRILTSDAARLAEDVGDGPWSPKLAAPKEQAGVLAGMIWASLGSPSAVVRWQAAHSVRRAARLGLWDVIDALFVFYDGPDAGAFQDQCLPFYRMHAQLWFLTSIARVALDEPGRVSKYRDALKRVALSNGMPHVALQEVAKRALLATYPRSGSGGPDKQLVSELAAVNKSPFPEVLWRYEDAPEFSPHRPKDVPEPDPDFDFEYDFNKYKIKGLADLFGYPDWVAADHCVGTIRYWDSKITSQYDFAGKPRPYGTRGYNAGTGDSYHSYGTYLAWHSVAATAGKLLRERAVRRRDYEENVWAEFLSHYQLTRDDGFWLSDGTDPVPTDALANLRVGNGKDAHPTTDTSALLALVGISPAKKIASALVVDASWSSRDDVAVEIESALVPPDLSRLAAVAVATAPPFHMWLPKHDSYEEHDYTHAVRSTRPLEPWLSKGTVYAKFDEKDPFGTTRVNERVRPSKDTVRKFHLQPDPHWYRTWELPNGKLALTSIAWGVHSGSGETEVWDSGAILRCEPGYLKSLLRGKNRNLILVVKLRHYLSSENYRDIDSDDRFSHSALVLLLTPLLDVEVISPTKRELKTIASMGEHSVYDFEARFFALANDMAIARKRS